MRHKLKKVMIGLFVLLSSILLLIAVPVLFVAIIGAMVFVVYKISIFVLRKLGLLKHYSSR